MPPFARLKTHPLTLLRRHVGGRFAVLACSPVGCALRPIQIAHMMLHTLGADTARWCLVGAAAPLRHRCHHSTAASMSARHQTRRVGMLLTSKARLPPADSMTSLRRLIQPSETPHSLGLSRYLGPLLSLCRPISRATTSVHPPESRFCSGFKRG